VTLIVRVENALESGNPFEFLNHFKENKKYLNINNVTFLQ
jgi:hypothetical protein